MTKQKTGTGNFLQVHIFVFHEQYNPTTESSGIYVAFRMPEKLKGISIFLSSYLFICIDFSIFIHTHTHTPIYNFTCNNCVVTISHSHIKYKCHIS